MAWWSKLLNVFRRDVTDDIDEELRLHLEEAVAGGRAPDEARRALGPSLRWREESRDARVIGWLDSLRADAVVAARQLRQRPVTSAAAVLSLALAIGACTAAFRVADAVLWRPLPIAHPERLHSLALVGVDPSGRVGRSYSWAYPQFAEMRTAAAPDAALLAVSLVQPSDITFGDAADVETARVQYVSGNLFPVFGLRPAVGRLFGPGDEAARGAAPLAVLSSAYWRRRFSADPSAVGRSLQMNGAIYTVIGVIDGPFAGTEPGARADVFLSTSMHPAYVKDDATWARVFVAAPPTTALPALRERVRAVWRAHETERAKGFSDMPPEAIAQMLNLGFDIAPAASGASRLEAAYRQPLAVLGVMVALVLLIACGNLANLMAAQAAARGREMALRASIGAGRGRLVQLVLVEGAVIALAAAAIGAVFAAWAAPFVVSMVNPPDNPAELWMPFDWRVSAFAAAITVAVVGLFASRPARQAAGTNPLTAMRGLGVRGTRRPVARSLLALQVAFCACVLFVGGLSLATFADLTSRDLGFAPQGVTTIALRPVAPMGATQWMNLRDAVAALPGVKRVALADWPMLTGNSWNGFVSINGAPAIPVLSDFLHVSPEFFDAMRLPLLAGASTTPNVVVNEAFLREFMPGVSPTSAIGQHFAKGASPFTIGGVMRDAVYRDIHEPVGPVVFVPYDPSAAASRAGVTVFVRAATDRIDWRAALRRASPLVTVTSVRSQQDVIDAGTLRERLLAWLAMFFSAVALALTGVGLYGMLHYAVIERHREIGIRRAIGATSARIAGGFAAGVAVIVAGGVTAGIAAGWLAAHVLESLFYGVRPSDPWALAWPAVAIGVAAISAAAAPLVRAIRIAPIDAIRCD